MDQYRRLKDRRNSLPSLTDLFTSDTPTQAKILDHVMGLYDQLPQRFKETPDAGTDASEDRFNFQAANITATLQVCTSHMTSSGMYIINMLEARPHGAVHDRAIISGAEILASWRIVSEHCHGPDPVSAGNIKSSSQSTQLMYE